MNETHHTITVRDSRPEDVPDIQRIYAHHVESGTASFEEVPRDMDEIATRRQVVVDFGAPYIGETLHLAVQFLRIKLAATPLGLGDLLFGFSLVRRCQADVPFEFLSRLGWLAIKIVKHVVQRRHFRI